jgi:glycosyltransferase involved in cell wall biosynthesis
MKILHTVESYLPIRHGMSEVVRQISERLVQGGIDITVATSHCAERQTHCINDVKVVSFDINGSFSTGYSGDTESYRSFLLNSDFDVIVNFAAQQWATDICITLLPKLRAKKIFVPTGFSGFYNPVFSSYYEKMKFWMKEYDMNVFLSNDYRDINFARDNDIERIVVIPNGASEEEFVTTSSDFNIRRFLNIPSSHKVVLHVGSYTGFKGHDETIDIFLKANIKNSTLVFVGSNLDQESDSYFLDKIFWFRRLSLTKLLTKRYYKAFLVFLWRLMKRSFFNIHAIRLSREETVSVFLSSDLFLFPSNIECSPIVLFESIASKTPFLVSDVGNAKEIIEWTGGGILLPTKIDREGLSHANIAESARVMKEVLSNENRLSDLGNQGNSSWKSKFTWEKITEEYKNLYSLLLG